MQEPPLVNQDALDQHGPWLRELALRLVRNEPDADDLVQRTWLEALSARGVRRLGPWLAGTMKVLAKSQTRAEASRGAVLRRIEEPAEGEPADAEVARGELAGQLQREIEKLEEPTRSVVMLRYLDGHDSAQVGEMLDMPVGTVRWRAKEGIDSLRRQLDRSQEGDGRGSWRALIGLAFPGSFRPTRAMAKASGGLSVASWLFLIIAGVILAVLAIQWPGGDRELGNDELVAGQVTVPLADELTSVEDQRGSAKEPNGETRRPSGAGLAAGEEPSIEVPPASRDDVDGETENPEKPWSIRVRVVDFETAKRLTGAEILLYSPEEEMVLGVTDRSGECLIAVGPEEMGTSGREILASTISLRARVDGAVVNSVYSVEKALLERGVITLQMGLPAEAGTIQGQVLDPETGPVAHAVVTARSAKGAFQISPTKGLFKTLVPLRAECDESGRFRLMGVPAGEIDVRAYATGHPIAEVRVKVQERVLSQCTIQMDAGAGVQGRVVLANGRVAVGARVWIDPHRTRHPRDEGGEPGFHAQLSGFAPMCRTDERGHFVLSGVTPGRVRLWAQAQDEPAHIATAELDLADRELGEWSPVLDRRNPMRIEFQDLGDTPRSGLEVFVMPAAGAPPGPAWQRRFVTHGAGILELWDVPSFRITVMVTQMGKAGPPLTLEEDLDPRESPHVVKLPARIPTGTLRGRVVYADDEPVTQGDLAFLSQEGPRLRSMLQLRTLGGFRAELPRGKYGLTVTLPGAGFADVGAATIEANVDQEVELRLPERGRLAPLEGVTSEMGDASLKIVAQSGIGTSDHRTTVVHSGWEDLDGGIRLLPGPYYIGTSLPNGQKSGTIVEVVSGATVRFDPRFRARPIVTIHVRDAQGNGVHGAEVECVDSDGARYAGSTDELGRWVEQMIPEVYRVTASDAAGRRATGEITVPAVGCWPSPLLMLQPASHSGDE